MPRTPPSATLFTKVLRVGSHFIGRKKSLGPALHYLGHAFGRNTQLGLRHAAIYAFMIFRDQAVSEDETADAVDDNPVALELLDLGDKARQRASITEIAVYDRIEEGPVVIIGIAMEEVFQHIGDGIAALMWAVDVIEIGTIFGEAGCQCLAVTSGRGRAEAGHECRKFPRQHDSFPPAPS